MVLVKSGPHPEAYVYKAFLTRIAPADYKSSSPEDYARHFTVMTFTNLPLIGMLLNCTMLMLSLPVTWLMQLRRGEARRILARL